jgi:hypothetical protein
MAGFRFPGPLCVMTAPIIDEGTLCRATSPLPGPVNFVAGSPAAAFYGDAFDDGMEFVLTPVQLAAIFENGTIESEGTLGARLWGGLSIIGGALEMVGAGALLLTPEPTMATKVAGGALGVHGMDTAGAGIRQVISGKSESTYTAEYGTPKALSGRPCGPTRRPSPHVPSPHKPGTEPASSSMQGASWVPAPFDRPISSCA